ERRWDGGARWLVGLRLERVGLPPTEVVESFNKNWERKPGSKFPVTSLREVTELAREPIEKTRKARTRYHADDVWLTVRFDFHKFPKIGFIQPYRKPHAKADTARTFFDSQREYVVDEVAIPLTEILRELDVALRDSTLRDSEARRRGVRA